MIKYKIEGWRWKAKIEPVEVERESAAFVFLPAHDGFRARREAKSAEYHEYHDTWELAHAALLQKSQERLVAARNNLAQEQGMHGNIKGMKP